MKLIVRAAVVTLVLSSAAASSLLPKTSNATAPVLTQNPIAMSDAIPVPVCDLGSECLR
jgi:hypothetical protein